jgi:hypothetical protein
VLLVVGSEHDAEARSVVAMAGEAHAALLSTADLSKPGWAVRTSDPARGRIVAGGKRMRAAEISGVLVRRLAVHPQELPGVKAADRDYVANEMTALLLWWLHVLPVPVINRPGGGLLCGPGWYAERWRAEAARLGFPVAPSGDRIRRRAISEEDKTEVVVIGDIVAGMPPLPLACRALELAHSAGIVLLSASFDADGQFESAHSMPRLTPDVVHGIIRYIECRA